MTAVIPRRGHSRSRQPGLVTLVRGDVRELDTIETAARFLPFEVSIKNTNSSTSW